MLDHLGETAAANAVLKAIESVLSSGNAPLTPDLGGSATTKDLGTAIARSVAK